MSDAETIEISMEQAREKIQRGDALERLYNNTDFKNIFLDGYLTEFAAEVVARKASMGGQDEKNQKFIDNQITAIGSVQVYMQMLAQEARVAKDSLESDEQELERILAKED